MGRLRGRPRTDEITAAVRDTPRGAEIDRELQASHGRLAKLAEEKPLTPGEALGVLRSRAECDPALAETVRAEEELVWALIRELTDIEIAVGDAMDSVN